MNTAMICAAAMAALAASPSYAFFAGQSAVANGHSFVSSCSGTGFGSFAQSGGAVSGGVSSAAQNCAYQVSATIGGNASVATSKSGSSFGHNYTSDTHAAAAVGTIHLFAENSGSTSTQFSGSQAVAGWNDSLTIAGAAGQQGILVIGLAIDGTLTSTGQAADSQFGIEALLNHNILQPYGNAINATAYNIFHAANSPLNIDDVYYGWDYQMKPWRETDYSGAKVRAVNQPVTFAIPFTFNVPFTLGIYAQVSAGESASGGYAVDNHSVVDFAHTIKWGGKGFVTNPGGLNPTSNFTIQSLSGFNYNVSAVPEAGSWGMLLAGFGVVGALARRRQRVVAA